MTESKKLSIYEIIPKVREEVGAIRKDQQASGGARYTYRGTDAVINALAPVLNKYGVFTTVEDIDFHHESGVTASNKVLTTVTLRKRVRFYGPAGDFVESITAGENSDYSDKATGGASTYAYRYALVQTFVLPTDEDDPDAKYVEKEAIAAPTTATVAPAPTGGLKALQDDLRKRSQKAAPDGRGKEYIEKIIADNPEKFADDKGELPTFNQVWKSEAQLKTLDELIAK